MGKLESKMAYIYTAQISVTGVPEVTEIELSKKGN